MVEVESEGCLALVASKHSWAVHSILEVGLLIGKMRGLSLHSAIASNTSFVNSLPAPARPISTVGFACSHSVGLCHQVGDPTLDSGIGAEQR